MKSERYKATDYLRTRRQVAAYLDAALKDGDPAVLLSALRTVAVARGGVGALAKAAGVSRESLYRSLSARGNPKIETLMALLGAMDLRLAISPRKAA